ncbi:ABC transporter permease [Sphingomonas sp. SORGH_AS_0879]|uniref:ABC transporter permease n=1 Tax=Sphingomonas sp. SORGH_AS_0879 TaxID=3041790 RepID=UPI00277E5909|nr:ABC transporter permease [Sphingomonas sp. SORGH_AS_0879]MDQ1229375.1 ABC-2 type transport system permease protein [Sphingomonas sp. SORGH_AS_0879]
MNLHGIWAIYRFEMARFRRTVWTSLMVPVITTTLYFVVFGTAIGSAMNQVSGVPYGAFIVPGLMLLSIFSESILNASLGIYMPKFTGTMYEILSAPLSPIETVLGYVGAAASKSMVIGLVILATAYLFVDLSILHPVAMLFYLLLVAATFSLFGFAIGIWARGFEQLQVIPLLIVTPLTFLGGAFYSVKILPEPWRTVTLFNPVVYLINGFRWTFFGTSDVAPGVSLGVTGLFLLVCLAWIGWIFRTGWRLKN